MRSRLHIFHCLAMGAVLLFSTLPAHATFPGKNGRIAFVEFPDVFTMNPDGSDVRQLTALTDGNSAFWESWSADGKQLVFSEFPAPDFFGQLWVMNADGSNQRLLLDDPGFDDEEPSFSADGSHIIFARCFDFHNEFPCAVYRIQADGTGLTALTPFRIELEDLYPVYSPDGNAISFSSFGRGGILGAIYLMNPDGSNIRRLTPAATGGFLSDWSPDGQALAFSSHCCNPQLPSVFSIRSNGQRMRQLTFDGGTFDDAGVSWSPQGDAIVFERFNPSDNTVGIWIISADGSHEKLIRKTPASALRRHSPRNLHRPARRGTPAVPKEIKDGGTVPRWGVAQ
jgi:Tol biopolymer transport system component